MLNKIISQEEIDHFKRWLRHARKMVIVSHLSPDGDSVGSSLGLWHYLSSAEREVQVIVPNAYPRFLRWMPGAKEILVYEDYPDFAKKLIDEADVVCCLDHNTPTRMGEMGEVVRRSPARKIMIDHHLDPDDFCQIIISHPEISSTSELIFRLICRMNGFEEMSKACAECLYTGMMTDTGGFTYNSNDPAIYYIISSLLAKGIDKDAIYRKVFNTYSEQRMRMMGYVLTTMKIFPQHHTALITLTEEEQQRFACMKGDTEGFANIPLSIENICCSCFLREDKERGLIKLSLRSVGTFPVNRLAKEFFNGGGHRNAAGGEFYGSFTDAVKRFEQAIEQYKPGLQAGAAENA